MLFPKKKAIQQTLRKNFILEVWSVSMCMLFLMKHCGRQQHSLYTPNVHFKIFYRTELAALPLEVNEIVKNLNSVLVYKIELLLTRADTFYWQKTKHLSKLKKLLSKKKSNFCLSKEKLGQDKVGHHLQQINHLITRVIRGLLQTLSEQDPGLLKLYETGLLFISSLNFNKTFSYREYNQLLAPIGVVFDSKTLVQFPLNTKEFVGMLFAGNKHAVMSLSSGASNTLTYKAVDSDHLKEAPSPQVMLPKPARPQENKQKIRPSGKKSKVKKEHQQSNKKIRENLMGLIQENSKQSLWDQLEEEIGEPEAPFLSPKITSHKFSLVLDMDETMIHYPEEILIQQEQANDQQYEHFILRPYLNEFLLELQKDYEIIIFTSASKNYADFILDRIEHLLSSLGNRRRQDSSATVPETLQNPQSRRGQGLVHDRPFPRFDSHFGQPAQEFYFAARKRRLYQALRGSIRRLCAQKIDSYFQGHSANPLVRHSRNHPGTQKVFGFQHIISS